MTLTNQKLLQTQICFGNTYNRNAEKLTLEEIQRDHGQAASGKLIVDLELKSIMGSNQGAKSEFCH